MNPTPEGAPPMEITKDAVVTAHYRFTDESGELVDSSERSGPMIYLHGRANVLPAIEAALAGQNAGYSTSLTLQPEQAFGAHRPELVFEAVRENLPPNVALKPGMPLFSGSGPARVSVARDRTDRTRGAARWQSPSGGKDSER